MHIKEEILDFNSAICKIPQYFSLDCSLNIHTHTHTPTQAERKGKKTTWQFHAMKNRLKFSNLGCYCTWEFSKARSKVSNDWNWSILLISNETLTAYLYSKIRKICLGQRILNRLSYFCKIWFFSPNFTKYFNRQFYYSLTKGSHMAKIPLKVCIFAWYLSKYYVTESRAHWQICWISLS